MSQATEYTWNYLRIGTVLGALLGVLVFFGSWFYCVTEYGFLIGVTLGWIPAGIAATVFGWLAKLLWGPLLAVMLIGVISAGWGERAPKDEGWEVVSEEPLATAADAAADAAAVAAIHAAEVESATPAVPAPPAYVPPARNYYPSTGAYEASRGDADCTQDCSGHEAGYEWAEDNGISDQGDCGGNSDSFIEGCIAYVEDNE